MSKEQPSIAATQRKVSDIWEQVLNAKDIGVTEDFFDLGGTSLDLIRVFEQVNEKFNISLNGSVLDDEATIARLSACIDAELHRSDAGRVSAAS